MLICQRINKFNHYINIFSKTHVNMSTLLMYIFDKTSTNWAISIYALGIIEIHVKNIVQRRIIGKFLYRE